MTAPNLSQQRHHGMTNGTGGQRRDSFTTATTASAQIPHQSGGYGPMAPPQAPPQSFYMMTPPNGLHIPTRKYRYFLINF
jgi:hypothetical protein